MSIHGVPNRIASPFPGLIAPVVLAVLLFGALAGCGAPPEEEEAANGYSVHDIDDHPLYKEYSFSSDDNIIDIGVQPLWIPTSILSEVMKRDAILADRLRALGVELVFHSFLKGNDVNHFLKKGDLDAGIGGDMPALRAVADGAVAVSLYQVGPVSIISRDVQEVVHLKGLRIGYALGSNAHFYLLNTLAKHGLDAGDVALVQMEVTQMPGALAAGKIDAFAAWEPTPAITLITYPDFKKTHQGRSYGFFYVSRKLFSEHPVIVRHLLASEVRALRWIRRSKNNIRTAAEWVRASAAAITDDAIPLSKEEMVDLALEDLPGVRIKNYPRISPRLLADDSPLMREFTFLQKLGFIENRADWYEVRNGFDREQMEQILIDSATFGVHEPLTLIHDTSR